ncbi:unnamed protein product [Spirodela intermedia]|uniref:Uncharacterized protein n=1 Tax=Spirodela intermedia TaxID=51605 RepID=A0A7I8JNU7_SPIIN|nr:unnamed protein product [Spirodela intermedia]CAA6671848.1 unnamed protein product [Spirodela intermedia]
MASSEIASSLEANTPAAAACTPEPSPPRSPRPPLPPRFSPPPSSPG